MQCFSSFSSQNMTKAPQEMIGEAEKNPL